MRRAAAYRFDPACGRCRAPRTPRPERIGRKQQLEHRRQLGRRFLPDTRGNSIATFDATGAFTPFAETNYSLRQLNVSGATLPVHRRRADSSGPTRINLSGATPALRHLIFGSVTTLTNSVDLAYAGVMSGGGGLIKAGAGRSR